MRKSCYMIAMVFVISLIGIYPAIAQLDKGLVLAITFDQSSGDTVRDASGYNNHGKVTGKVDWKAGKYGNAFHLDGATHIAVPNKTPLTLLTHPMTVGCWINPDSVTGWHNILEMDRTNADKKGGWKLGLNATKNLVWTTYGVKDFAATSVVTVGQWTHVAATWDGAQAIVYYNGKPDAPIAGGGVINVKDATDVPSLDIGWRRSSAASFFIGSIDDLFVYNRVLSQAEINELTTKLSALAVEPHSKITTTWGALKF